MNNIIKFLSATLATVVVLGALVLALLSITNIVDTYTCNRYGRITGREVRHAFPNACYVKTERGWFTMEQIRDVAP